MATEMQRLTFAHLKVGSPLPGNIYDESGQLLLSEGFVIEDRSHLEALLERGLYGDIAAFDSHFNSAPIAPAPPATEAKQFDPFLLRDSIKRRLNRSLRDLGREADAIERVIKEVSNIRELAGTDPEGAIAACLLDNDENYSISHSVLTAILCDLTSTALGWSEGKRSSVVCAALTMNATMLEQQNKLVDQAEALNPQQQSLRRDHPETACNALRKAGVDDPLWLAAVLEHHELAGGKGYPHGLAQPDEAGQLVRLADMFGALVSPRADRKAMPPPQAVRTLLTQEGNGPYAVLAGTLVKVLGLFPPGTFVKLANGEIAVVHRHGSVANAPLVASITTRSGNPYMKPLRRDTQHKEFAIAGLTLRGKLKTGYDLGMLWLRT